MTIDDNKDLKETNNKKKKVYFRSYNKNDKELVKHYRRIGDLHNLEMKYLKESDKMFNDNQKFNEIYYNFKKKYMTGSRERNPTSMSRTFGGSTLNKENHKESNKDITIDSKDSKYHASAKRNPSSGFDRNSRLKETINSFDKPFSSINSEVNSMHNNTQLVILNKLKSSSSTIAVRTNNKRDDYLKSLFNNQELEENNKIINSYTNRFNNAKSTSSIFSNSNDFRSTNFSSKQNKTASFPNISANTNEKSDTNNLPTFRQITSFHSRTHSSFPNIK